MTRRRLSFQIATALVLVLVCTALKVAAKDGPPAPSQSSLAVSPAIIEHILTPGVPAKFTIQVSNVTNFPLPVKGMVRNFTVQSADLERTDQARLDASQWFTLDEPDFIIQPKQVRTIKGTILAPPDAIPGGHYATIFFQPLIPQEALSPTTISLSAKVGVLGMLIVKGDIAQKADYQKKLATVGLIARGPAHFTFSVRNTGNVHLMPNGKLLIYDWQNHEVAKIDVPIGVILPDATREYEVQWDAPNAFGKYRGALELTYGDENTALQKTTADFWIIPWFEIVTVTLFGGLVIFFIIRTRHRWRKAWRTLTGREMRFHN